MRYGQGVTVAVVPLNAAKLRRLIAEFGGQSAVAGLLGVHRSRVTRWLAGDTPDPDNQARLDALEYILARLAQVYSAQTGRKWLHGINAHLGNRRPIDLVAANRIAEVIAAIEQADLGAHA